MKIFVSYTRNKDNFQKVSAFRERLEAEIGIRVPGSKVFQDKQHIQEGDHFPEVLTTELAKSDLLLVLVSPAWLQSEWCRREFALFTNAGANTKRMHRILPVLWVDTPDMHAQSSDSVARTLASINHADWRDLRFRSWGDTASQREIGRLADRAVSLVRASGQSWQADSPAPNASPTGELPEFTVIRLLRDQRFLPEPKHQPWREVSEEREASMLKFKRNFVTLPDSAEPNFVLTDPAFDVQVKNESSRPLVCHRVGIRIVNRQAGKFGGGSTGYSKILRMQSEFKIHCPNEWKPLRGTINDRRWTDFPDPIEMKKADSAFRFTLMLENFCDTENSLSSEVKLYLDTDNGRVESKSIWLDQ